VDPDRIRMQLWTWIQIQNLDGESDPQKKDLPSFEELDILTERLANIATYVSKNAKIFLFVVIKNL
jgi:hypothetical protein